MNQLGVLPPANEVCESYVFTPVCHSVHGGGVSRQRPRVEVRGSKATAAGGMHPTAMHSCSTYFHSIR